MVKFGRHLQFFLELEGLDQNDEHETSTTKTTLFQKDQRNLTIHDIEYNNHYIVPYNILRDAIESEQGSSNNNNSSSSGGSSSSTYYLTPSSFEMEWRDALSKSNLDFSESMGTCWKSIFDSIDLYQYHQQQKQQRRHSVDDSPRRNNFNNQVMNVTTRGMELMDAIQVYTQINDIVSSRDLLCFLKDTYNAAEINYQALRKIVKKFDKKYHSIHDDERKQRHNQHYMNEYYEREENGFVSGADGASKSSSNMLSVHLLPELYSSILFVGRGMLEAAITHLRALIEELASTSTGDLEGTDDSDADQITAFSLSPTESNNNEKVFQRVPVDDEDDHENNKKYITTTANNNNRGYKSDRRDQVQSRHNTNDHRYNKQSSTLNISTRGSAHGQNGRHESDEEDLIMKRADEMQWLNNIVKDIPKSELQHMVAHRGFHTSQGRSDFRPLENSLSAFESAWSAGIHLCECDIALTKDEKLVLAHDEDFNRLALDKTSNSSRVKVSELTFKELIALTLKNGVRAPLLKDVLMSANAIGPEAKLIIEIKPGNSEAGLALARLLLKYPELLTHVAVIMSFDLWSMHSLCAELHRLLPQFHNSISNEVYDSQRFESSPTGQSLLVHQTTNSIERTRTNSLVSYDSIYKASLPKLMLLTVADQPENRFELCVDVSDYSQIDAWLNGTSTKLDGVYVRCQPEMLLPEGKAALQELAKKYTVGVWGKAGEDPDDHRMMHYLVKECGVTYYNTDLPRSF